MSIKSVYVCDTCGVSEPGREILPRGWRTIAVLCKESQVEYGRFEICNTCNIKTLGCSEKPAPAKITISLVSNT